MLKFINLVGIIFLSSCSIHRELASSSSSKYDVGYFTDSEQLTGAVNAECEGLPSIINIKTPTRTFNFLFYIALTDEGLICVKPIKPFKNYQSSWQLLNKTGLVDDKEEQKFDRPEKVISLQADADEVIAMSNDLRLYFFRWLKNPTFPGKPGHWNDLLGWPLTEKFIIGKRVLGTKTKEEVTKNPWLLNWGIGRRNQIVGHFEDAAGRSHTGGGGLTSYYFLSPKGDEIYFSDSGLPTDQSHTMNGPRRGRFHIRGLDVSASTVFVINDRGEMFTRMADFDTIGSDVMFFNYSYNKNVIDPDTFIIPSEDWLEHDKIKLKGNAKISSVITIVLTGQGNTGRELRVAGTDSEGRIGHYFKAINKKGDWSFHLDNNIQIPEWRFLNPDNERDDFPLKDHILMGKIIISEKNKKEIVLNAIIPDFNLYSSPMLLNIDYKGKTYNLKLHLVEQWFHLKRFAPGSDGTPYQTMGTLEFLQNDNNNLPAPLKNLHLKEFSLWGESTNQYLKLEGREEILPKIEMSFIDNKSNYATGEMAQRFELVKDGFGEVARSNEIKMSPEELKTTLNQKKLNDLIILNEEVLASIKNMHESFLNDDAKTPFYITPSGFSFVNILFKVFKWHKKIKTISENVGIMLSHDNGVKTRMRFLSIDDYKRAEALIKDRIFAYKKRLSDIELKHQSEWYMVEDDKEFWANNFAFGVRRVDHSLSGCEVAVVDNDFARSINLKINCGRESALYNISLLGMREYFLNHSKEKGFDFKIWLYLREKTKNFPHELPNDLKGFFSLSQGQYEIKSDLSFKW